MKTKYNRLVASRFAIAAKLCLFLFISSHLAAQDMLTIWQVEMFGSASSGVNTPFWIVSNNDGLVPLESNNGYMRACVFSDIQKYKWQFSGGLDMIAAAPRHRNVYVQQAYADISYKWLNLSIGSKQNYTSLWDINLSSGDMVMSSNSRPIPEINVSTPNFVPLTNWLHFRGDFAVGRSFDGDYLNWFRNERQYYVHGILWHHKSFFLRFLDGADDFPFTATAGLRHHAQWGGVSSDPRVGRQPASFKDFLRVVAGSSGGEDATASDRTNVLGNHYGSYDLKLGYLSDGFSVYLYKQHFFDDASGRELFNFSDGLYGLQVYFPRLPECNKIVVEYLDTRDQSGPVHHILFDHDKYPGFGGGSDEYYNNFEYPSGLSYFNRSVGSPLLTSPEYNAGGRLGFLNNRVRALHIAFEGYLSKQVEYRVKATASENWGTMFRPFLKKKNAASCALRLSYGHPLLLNWRFSTELAADAGALYGRNVGVSLSIVKTGVVF